MKAHTASLINAITLIAMSLWGYFSSETPSMTALIPTIIGVLLLAINKGVKAENKMIAHVAVLLTLIILLGLLQAFTGAMGRSDNAAMTRVGIMIATTVMAMVYFVKSFIDARKNRAA